MEHKTRGKSQRGWLQWNPKEEPLKERKKEREIERGRDREPGNPIKDHQGIGMYSGCFVSGGSVGWYFFLLGERGEDGPHELVGALLGALLVEVKVEQVAHPLHGQLIVVVVERRERVLQHVGRVRQENQRQHSLVDALGVVHPPGQHRVLHLLDQTRFHDVIRQRVRRHVEKEEVLLLCGEDTLLNKVLGQPLADVLQLVAEFEGVPGLTREVFNPVLDRFGRLRLLDVSEGLIEEDVTSGCVVLQ